MRVVALDAHASMERPLEPEAVVDLAALSALVSIEAGSAGRFRLRTRGLVGTAVSGGTRLVIRPRHLSRAVVLGMISGPAAALLTALPAVAAEDDDLLRVLGMALCDTTRRLLQRGLRHQYADRNVQDEVLRGEIVLDRWRGPLHPDHGARPWMRVRERHPDLPEHRLLRVALRRLGRSAAADVPLRRRAAELEARLHPVPPHLPPTSVWPRLRTTGLFASYAHPIELARILLAGVLGEGEGARGSGFVLDLDRLFESWLAKELTRLVPAGWTVAAQQPVRVAEPVVQRFLDVAIRDRRGVLRMVIDAKNKDLSGRQPPRQDLHQLVTYLATTRCSRGALVGMGPVPSRRPFRLSGGVGVVEVVTLPGRGTIAEVREALVTWAAKALPAGPARCSA